MSAVERTTAGLLLEWPVCATCRVPLKHVGADKDDETYKPCHEHPDAKAQRVHLCRMCLRAEVTASDPVYHGWHVCRPCYDAKVAWWRRHGGSYFREERKEKR